MIGDSDTIFNMYYIVHAWVVIKIEHQKDTCHNKFGMLEYISTNMIGSIVNEIGAREFIMWSFKQIS